MTKFLHSTKPTVNKTYLWYRGFTVLDRSKNGQFRRKISQILPTTTIFDDFAEKKRDLIPDIIVHSYLKEESRIYRFIYRNKTFSFSSNSTWKIKGMFHFSALPPFNQTKVCPCCKADVRHVKKLHINTCDCQTFCLCRLWSFLSLFQLLYMKNVLTPSVKETKKTVGDKQCYNDK